MLPVFDSIVLRGLLSVGRDRLRFRALPVIGRVVLRGLLSVCAAVGIWAVSGCGVSDLGSPAASVGKVEYQVDDLHAYLATVDSANEAVAPRTAAAEWLGNWAFFTAVELEMAERGVRISETHRGQALENLQDVNGFDPSAAGSDIAINQNALVFAVLEWSEREVPDITDAELEDSVGLRLLCVNHILVSSETEMNAVLGRLSDGEQFFDLAVEVSLDPGSAPFGGELGCAIEGTFIRSFEDAAYAAAPGEIVTTASQYGFHVIEVVSTGLPTAQNHPQLDAEYLRQLAFDAEFQARDTADRRVEIGRQNLIADLEATVLDRYADQVTIKPRYGVWDEDLFTVVVARPSVSG